MTGWSAERTPGRPARAVIAVTLLALLLVAAVPVALLAGVVIMMLGHAAGGLALFGGRSRVPEGSGSASPPDGGSGPDGLRDLGHLVHDLQKVGELIGWGIGTDFD